MKYLLGTVIIFVLLFNEIQTSSCTKSSPQRKPRMPLRVTRIISDGISKRDSFEEHLDRGRMVSQHPGVSDTHANMNLVDRQIANQHHRQNLDSYNSQPLTLAERQVANQHHRQDLETYNSQALTLAERQIAKQYHNQYMGSHNSQPLTLAVPQIANEHHKQYLESYNSEPLRQVANQHHRQDPEWYDYEPLTLAERQIANQHQRQDLELHSLQMPAHPSGGIPENEHIQTYTHVPVRKNPYEVYGHSHQTLYPSYNPITNFHHSGSYSSASGEHPPETKDLLGTMFQNSPSSSSVHDTYGGYNQNQEGHYKGSGSGSGSGSGYHK